MSKKNEKKDLWMPLYVGDYLRDTGHLTTEEHGAYFLLIMQAWTKGGILPVNEAPLRSITKMDPKAWKASSATLLAFFQVDGDVLRHKRITIELATTGSISEKRKSAGKAGGEAKAKNTKQTDSIGGGKLPTPDVANGVANDLANDLANGKQKGRPSPSPSAFAIAQAGDGEAAPPLSKPSITASAVTEEEPPIDDVTRLWRDGLKIVRALIKQADGPARKLLGKWTEAIGADHVAMLEILKAAETTQPDQPVPWIRASIDHHVGKLPLHAPDDPYGVRAWAARQPDARAPNPGDPICINGFVVEMSAQIVADAIGIADAAIGTRSACGYAMISTSPTRTCCAP
jgi:uncharacterized protein YdaU (DUF1376 family)